MQLQLKTIFGELIFEGDFSSVAELVKSAIAAKKNLSGANLSGANLSDANLSGANLSDANLSGANLSGANLSDANLSDIKNDVWAILTQSRHEVPALRAALAEGRVDGNVYEGECACLVGTLNKGRRAAGRTIIPGNVSRPAEQWFLHILKGDTPATNQMAAIALEWVDEWLALMSDAAPANA